ncbi:hypothetical protein HPB50_018764 [Hyalomma asiaticum]|uniref:Uncharacterized protein n=1 Tax=Hyalomma asiaticum TaxID=266040 RepID=A0ACB7S4X6_HYAAI|nr:hypothetical protein HPB50_018764 [Hyalomma asiaticum]
MFTYYLRSGEVQSFESLQELLIAHRLKKLMPNDLLSIVTLQEVKGWLKPKDIAELAANFEESLDGSRQSNYRGTALRNQDYRPQTPRAEHIAREQGIELADKLPYGYHSGVGVDLLVGADYYWDITTGNMKLLNGQLVAAETAFGWTLQVTDAAPSAATAFENITFRKDGRCEVRLPWNENAFDLTDNENAASRRLQSLTVKLLRNEETICEHDQAIRSYFQDGHAEEANKLGESPLGPIYYIPHRGLFRPGSETTELSIVFEDSSKAAGQLSLNDALFAGPT